MVKKKGKPRGCYTHPDSLFTQFLSSEFPKTPSVVRRDIHSKFGLWVSWNTIHNRLDILVENGLVKKFGGTGRYHQYMNMKYDRVVGC